jgi:hypothetical protein
MMVRIFRHAPEMETARIFWQTSALRFRRTQCRGMPPNSGEHNVAAFWKQAELAIWCNLIR